MANVFLLKNDKIQRERENFFMIMMSSKDKAGLRGSIWLLVLKIFVFTLIKKEDNGPNSKKITLLSVELLIPHFLKEKWETACLPKFNCI